MPPSISTLRAPWSNILARLIDASLTVQARLEAMIRCFEGEGAGMIIPDQWADTWIDAWNRCDLEALLCLYADDIQLRSPFARVYATSGVIKGKGELRSYWAEAMRRMPNFALEKVAVYRGHLALALHCRDNIGRNWIETILFNERDQATYETACLDKVR